MKFALAAATALALLSASPTAQSFSAFGTRPEADLPPRTLSDQDVTGLMGALDRVLSAVPAGTKWSDHAGEALWQFARRIQASQLTRTQEARVLAHLDGVARSKPGGVAVVAGPRRMISTFAVGKPAPDITGRDLDGRPFRLSEYRNKVVLLRFTAEWCGICRAQAPYERFLLDKYARWPLAILGVEAGSDREKARQAHIAGPVSHRVWWDEPAPPERTSEKAAETRGPIAAAWNVSGWPASFLIDGDGIIQFVDVRDESLLIAVRQLVDVQADRDLRAQKTRGR